MPELVNYMQSIPLAFTSSTSPCSRSILTQTVTFRILHPRRSWRLRNKRRVRGARKISFARDKPREWRETRDPFASFLEGFRTSGEREFFSRPPRAHLPTELFIGVRFVTSEWQYVRKNAFKMLLFRWYIIYAECNTRIKWKTRIIVQNACIFQSCKFSRSNEKLSVEQTYVHDAIYRWRGTVIALRDVSFVKCFWRILRVSQH